MQNQIPENWQKVKLGEYAGVLGGFAFSSKTFNTQGKGTPVLKIKNLLDNGVVNVDETEYVDLDKVNK
ncbi:MAG: hypothetical protein NTV24_01190, partial [Candidatus Woesebacteria bacterium]|nr:hypothetical protein [Candidatus Woesebacteria bacterium]